MSRLVCALALSLSATLAWAEQGVNPHVHASTCFPGQRVSCDYSICQLCHTPSSLAPAAVSAQWGTGNRSLSETYPVAESTAKLTFSLDEIRILCAQCHDVEPSGFHPASAEYQTLLAKLVTVTEGANLLDPNATAPCALQCLTCHDPHSREPHLLRPNVETSVTCLTCHME